MLNACENCLNAYMQHYGLVFFQQAQTPTNSKHHLTQMCTAFKANLCKIHFNNKARF